MTKVDLAAVETLAEQRDCSIHPNVYGQMLADCAAELRALRARVAELEASETKLIAERDDAEDALSDAYNAVFASGPILEWTSVYHYEDAVRDIAYETQRLIRVLVDAEKHIAELEAAQKPRPMADAPHDEDVLLWYAPSVTSPKGCFKVGPASWGKLFANGYSNRGMSQADGWLPLPPTGDAKK